MRDAVGGAFMIKVFIVFLLIYIVFIAVAFNYARAFRVKNKIIDIIEQNEGIDSFSNTSGVIGKINTNLNTYHYRSDINENDCKFNNTNNNVSNNYFNEEYGYCITEYKSTSQYDRITAKYYKVTTFATIEFPFFNLKFEIPVKGETRKVERIG